MKSITAYLIYILISAVITISCKKHPDGIQIILYDPLLDQPISNAQVALVESSFSSDLSNGKTDCNIIKTMKTNADGEALIEKATLKNNKKYKYFIAVSECYNTKIAFSCSNQTNENELQKSNGHISKKVYFFLFESFSWIQLQNLKTFGINPTDSFSVVLYKNFSESPDFNSEFNGDKGYRTGISLNKSLFQSFPAGIEIIDAKYKTPSGNYKVIMYKRKNNVISNDTVFLKINPKEEKAIEYIW